MACPACGSELSLEHLLGSADDERAFARLVALSVPLAHLVVRYIALFAPPKQRLTLRKKVRLIAQILPDLQRGAITHKGRDWAAPQAAWAQGIDQMLGARDAGRLDLPMTGHGYLYAILAAQADKAEATQEQQREQAQRLRQQPGPVQVRGQAVAVGDVLAAAPAGRDPALAALDAATRNAAPMPDAVRQRLAALRGAAPTQQPQKGEQP